MNEGIKLILLAVVNDCRKFFNDYFYKGIITGEVLALLYCIILLCKAVFRKKMPRCSLVFECMLIGFCICKGVGRALSGRHISGCFCREKEQQVSWESIWK